MNNDHAQEFWWHFPEHGRYPDLTLDLEFCALHPRDAGVRAQCVQEDMQLAVELRLAQLPSVALALAGGEAFDRADYKTAIDYWKRIKAVAPTGSMEVKLADSNIAEATAQMSGKKP